MGLGGAKTVLTTGCAGYLGCQLVPHLLARGHRVIGIDKAEAAGSLYGFLGHPEFRFVAGDAREVPEFLLAMSDVVIPLAAVVGYRACGEDAKGAAEVNAGAVRDLVGRMSNHQRVLYPMTNSGYGTKVRKAEYTEEDPLEPHTEYGLTKLDGEKAVLDHPLGVSLRLASLFGASPKMRWDLMLHDFVGRVRQGGPVEVFEGGARRNFVHVRDVSRAFCLMAAQPRYAGVFNVNLPEHLSKFELIGRIGSQLGLQPVVVPVEKNDPDKRDYQISTEKLLRTGFRYEFGIDDGVQEVSLAWNSTSSASCC